jgi:hypothetical protein
VLAHPDTDGFPLSTYPMFSTPRPAVASFVTVVGADGAGRSRWLSPTLANGTREVVQAAAVVNRQVAAGRAADLCTEVAARLAGAGPGTTREIEVVTLRYDTVAYFSSANLAGPSPADPPAIPTAQHTPATPGTPTNPATPGTPGRSDGPDPPDGPAPTAAGPAGPQSTVVHARCPVPR